MREKGRKGKKGEREREKKINAKIGLHTLIVIMIVRGSNTNLNNTTVVTIRGGRTTPSFRTSAHDTSVK